MMLHAAEILLACCVAGAALWGCAGPHPFVREGNQNSVEVVYSGDVATAQPLAQQHCRQYERVPRLVSRDGETALFNCVSPPPAP
jgi:hypothetical protein